MAVDVGLPDFVEVHEADFSHARPRETLHRIPPDSPEADNANRCLKKPCHRIIPEEKAGAGIPSGIRSTSVFFFHKIMIFVLKFRLRLPIILNRKKYAERNLIHNIWKGNPMSTLGDTDYKSMMNDIRLNNANSLFGGGGSVTPGISGDLLRDWQMLGANSNAYKKLLEAEKNGGVRPKDTFELASDKYLNENYNPKTKTYNKAKYTSPVDQVQVDPEATTGDQLEDMRSLALAAINDKNSLNPMQYDFFEKMRQNIASNLNTKGSKDKDGEKVTGEAAAAEAKSTVDYRLLLEDQSIVVAGTEGEKTYNFTAGMGLEEVVAAINADTGDTGVKAALAENDDGKFEITFTSEDAGKDAFVRVDQNIGNLFAKNGSSISGTGKDGEAKDAETVATSEDTQAAMVAGTPYGKLFEDNAFTIQGANGSHSFSFGKGTDVAEIIDAINAQAESTGIKAEAIMADDGTVAGIGLLADKTGAGNYIQVKQDKGDLFAAAGKTASVAGSSHREGSEEGGPVINKLEDLGKVKVGDQVYSFADLAPGGKASLSENPDIALAVIDQAIKDIAEGRAEVVGFDKSELYVPGVTTGAVDGSTASTNTREHNNYGNQAISDWLDKYTMEED